MRHNTTGWSHAFLNMRRSVGLGHSRAAPTFDRQHAHGPLLSCTTPRHHGAHKIMITMHASFVFKNSVTLASSVSFSSGRTFFFKKKIFAILTAVAVVGQEVCGASSALVPVAQHLLVVRTEVDVGKRIEGLGDLLVLGRRLLCTACHRGTHAIHEIVGHHSRRACTTARGPSKQPHDDEAYDGDADDKSANRDTAPFSSWHVPILRRVVRATMVTDLPPFPSHPQKKPNASSRLARLRGLARDVICCARSVHVLGMMMATRLAWWTWPFRVCCPPSSS